MNKKDKIKEILSKLNKQPVLFIGSGFSKRYLNLENWEGLLKKFIAEITDDKFKYSSYYNKIESSNYYGKQAGIASLLEKDYNNAIFEQDKFSDFKKRNAYEIQQGVSPFKIAISEYMESINLNITNEEIELLKEIGIRNISGVITTNYDCFLEKIFLNFKTYSSQEELIFSNIENIGEIYKIHGTSKIPNSIIITSEDYKKFEEKSDYLTAKLLTIFIEYPIIFLGYSLKDRNIQNIFNSIAKCLNEKQLKKLKEQLIFIHRNTEEESVSTHSINFSNEKSIEMLKIETNDYKSIFEAIKEIKPKFNPKVIRQLKKEIYKLAETENPKTYIVATGFENLDKLDENNEYVINVGINQKYGIPIKAEDIYKDTIFDSGGLGIDLLINTYFPILLKTNSGGLPIYKYLKNFDKILPEEIKNMIVSKNSIDDFLNNSLKKEKENFRKTLKDKSIKEILKIFPLEGYKKILFLEENEINIEELENYLKNIFNDKIIQKNTQLKRLIRIYDFLKYKNNWYFFFNMIV